MRVGPVGARRPVRAAADRRVREDRDVVAEPLRADEPFREPALREVLVLERPDALGEVQAGELLLVHLAVPGHEHRDRPALDVEQDALHRGLGRDPHLLDHQLDRHGAGRLDLRQRLGVLGGGLRRSRRRGLRVREVVTVLAPNEEVLPDVGERHELVVHAATDLAGVGFDDHVVEPEPIEHLDVGVVHHAIGLTHPTLVPVERVRVLHQELSAAQQAIARTELVPVLPLDLIHVRRQVSVRRKLLLRQLGDDLLLRRTEEELAAVSVLEPEDQLAVRGPATGRLPWLRGQDDRHPELLGTGGVHLLTHDPLDLVHRAEPERHRRVDAGRGLADERGAEQQAMRRDVGLRRILPERARE